jgi:hypothetical protein
MQGGKNWFLPKEMNANRFFWDSHWLEIWSNHFYPSMGPNGGSVAMDSGLSLLETFAIHWTDTGQWDSLYRVQSPIVGTRNTVFSTVVFSYIKYREHLRQI